ncbi:unnamed protein product [Parajaminaea phylloscopi]
MAKLPPHHHLWATTTTTTTTAASGTTSRTSVVIRRSVAAANNPHHRLRHVRSAAAGARGGRQHVAHVAKTTYPHQSQHDECSANYDPPGLLEDSAADLQCSIDIVETYPPEAPMASTSALTLDDLALATQAAMAPVYRWPSQQHQRLLWEGRPWAPNVPVPAPTTITTAFTASAWSGHRAFSSSSAARFGRSFALHNSDIVRGWTNPDLPDSFECLSLSEDPPPRRTPSPPNFTLPPLEPASRAGSEDSRHLFDSSGSSGAEYAATSSYHGNAATHSHQGPTTFNPIDALSSAAKGRPSGSARGTHPTSQPTSQPTLHPLPFFPPTRTMVANAGSLDGQASPTTPTRKSFSLHHHSDGAGQAVLPPLFEFRHGAYGIPKRHPLATSGSRSSTGASNRPSRGMLAAAADFLTGPPPPAPPAPRTASTPSPTSSQRRSGIDTDSLRSVQVGEDAYFLRPDSLGVADGVGGWATRPGANPAMFSRLLMHFCSVELSRHDGCLSRSRHLGDDAEYDRAMRKFWDVDPVEVMHRAWERCVRVSRREGILGSSTALLALLRGNELRIANLGDCVLLIVRRGQLLFRSQEQQHSFNFPVQLGMMIKRGTGSNEGSGDEHSLGLDEPTAAPPGEDLDKPEDEQTLLENRRRLGEEAKAKSGLSAQFEQEQRDRERDEKRRRAEFEGKDMAEFEAELEAAEDFDFDVQTGASRGVDANGEAPAPGIASDNEHEREHEHEDNEEGDRHTVYLGFNDAHPWDEPRRDCGRWTIRVQEGDIIIVASDGLVDNLFDDDIMEEVTRFAPDAGQTHEGPNDDDNEDAAAAAGAGADAKGHEGPTHTTYPPSDFSPQLLSEALCSRAKAISQDSKAVISPFQQRATEEGLHYVGGKHDDISVLVAVVGEASQPQGDGKERGGLELRG